MQTVNWQQTLTDVEHSIGECLETLDRYEAAFAQAIAEVDPVVTLDRLQLPEIAPLHEAKLAEAERTTQDVEDLLKEQDGIWSRWKATLATWHQLIDGKMSATELYRRGEASIADLGGPIEYNSRKR